MCVHAHFDGVSQLFVCGAAAEVLFSAHLQQDLEVRQI